MREIERLLNRFRDEKIRRWDVESRLNELWLDSTISWAQYDRTMLRLDVIESQREPLLRSA